MILWHKTSHPLLPVAAYVDRLVGVNDFRINITQLSKGARCETKTHNL